MHKTQKRKKSSHYYKAPKRQRTFILKPGLKGFLCTTNQENRCVKEAYNILNTYADKLYGTELKDDRTSTTDKEDEEDIEVDLEQELNTLKEENQKPLDMRRFQIVESGAKNCLFIQTTVPDPVHLVDTIMKDVALTKQQLTRFLFRLLPVEITCKAYMDDITAAADPLFQKYFSVEEETTFAIILNRRNNSSLNRLELTENLAKQALSKSTKLRADLKHPQVAVLIEVIRNICCISVVQNYFEFRKFNLVELCKTQVPLTGVVTTDNTGDTGEMVDSTAETNVESAVKEDCNETRKTCTSTGIEEVDNLCQEKSAVTEGEQEKSAVTEGERRQ